MLSLKSNCKIKLIVLTIKYLNKKDISLSLGMEFNCLEAHNSKRLIGFCNNNIVHGTIIYLSNKNFHVNKLTNFIEQTIVKFLKKQQISLLIGFHIKNGNAVNIYDPKLFKGNTSEYVDKEKK